MLRSYLAGIIGVIVIIGLIVLYAAMRPIPAKAPVPSKLVEHAQYYDITAQLATSTPLLSSVGRGADVAAVALMKGFIDETIAQFKADGDFSNLTQEDIKIMGFDQGRKETLEISYLTSTSPRTVSYIYNIYADTLGAHGNTFYHTFTFDLKTGKNLSLPDLFVLDAPYLETLSILSRAKLPDIIGPESVDKDMIENGTEPLDSNFDAFFLDGRSLVILFPPYAVAPYSEGTQTLPIPVSELKTILKPEYQ